MKVIINNAEMVPTPKKGTIIRFGHENPHN